MSDADAKRFAHLRAIRTAVVGLALGVVTAALVLHDEPLAFPSLIATLVILLYSFLPTLIRA
jgi:hypothetical protein